MTGDLELELPAYPDLRDPRVLVAVPREARARLTALWALAERLTKLLLDAREPLIGQIKLAWWRDMMAMLASDPAALPKGEPLLAELQANWTGAPLDGLVDAAEAMLIADDVASRREAAAAFGAVLFGLSGGPSGAGARWGLLWGAGVQGGESEARDLLSEADRSPPIPLAIFRKNKALLMLDRWAAAIAAQGGERRLRGEGLLLLRLGLIGR